MARRREHDEAPVWTYCVVWSPVALVLTQQDLCRLCMKERQGGRVPPSIEFLFAELPPELATRLRDARRRSSDEVLPRATPEVES